jgi:hypothetical protein
MEIFELIDILKDIGENPDDKLKDSYDIIDALITFIEDDNITEIVEEMIWKS